MRPLVPLAAALAMAFPAMASAGVVVTEGASGTGNNLLYNACGDSSGVTVPAGGVVGCLNARPDTFIVLSSTEALDTPSGGQARVEAVDGLFNSLLIDFWDDTIFFDTLVLNIIADEDGSIDFGDGVVRALSGNGNNFFTLAFDPSVNFFSFGATTGFWVDVRQIRFNFESGETNIPEPGMLGLLGLGLAGLGLARRRRSA